MKRKTKILIILLIILFVILISLWLALHSKSLLQPQSEHPTKSTTKLETVIQQSTWKYDLQNPSRKAQYISVAPEGITEKYLPVWKKLFMEKNNISEDYFKNHIQILETGVSTDQSRQLSPDSRGREYFEILYHIKVDWIELNNSDHLAIRKKDQQEYLTINEFIVEEKNAKEAFQQISKFSPMDKAPTSFEETVKKLQSIDSDAEYLKPVYLTLDYNIPRYNKEQISNGNILLYGTGTINYKLPRPKVRGILSQ